MSCMLRGRAQHQGDSLGWDTAETCHKGQDRISLSVESANPPDLASQVAEAS